MDPIQQIDNTNLSPIRTRNTNQIQKVGIDGPSIIPTIEKPILKETPRPVVTGLELPIVNIPNPAINYPVIDVPTQEEFNAAVNAERQKQQEQQQEKSRGLPDANTEVPPVATTQQPAQQSPTPQIEVPPQSQTPTFTFNGIDINLPDPSIVATAGAVAVVTTATTMVSGIALNMVKNAAEPLLREAVKNKFKIKLKQVKPVLHYVMTDTGHVDIFEYSAEGTKLIDTTDNVENYIRAQVETNAFYETENKIIIDDVVEEKFTKEGQKRFKPLFAPAKKIAKKLSARLSF
jgi:hypothetical protein